MRRAQIVFFGVREVFHYHRDVRLEMHNRSIPIRALLLCGTGIGLAAVMKIHNRC